MPKIFLIRQLAACYDVVIVPDEFLARHADLSPEDLRDHVGSEFHSSVYDGLYAIETLEVPEHLQRGAAAIANNADEYPDEDADDREDEDPNGAFAPLTEELSAAMAAARKWAGTDAEFMRMYHEEMYGPAQPVADA